MTDELAQVVATHEQANTKHFFSKTNNSFYAESLKARYEASGSWPDDLVEVSDEDYQKYIQVPPEGKKRGATRGGKPTWIAIPKNEILERDQTLARYWRNDELLRVDVVINKIEDFEIEGDSKVWRKYRVALRNWPQAEGFPSDESKPVAPDA